MNSHLTPLYVRALQRVREAYSSFSLPLTSPSLTGSLGPRGSDCDVRRPAYDADAPCDGTFPSSRSRW